MFHPANTARSTNPVYVVRGRETGYVSTGKFVQYKLEQQGETEAKIAVDEMSDTARQQVWSDRVRRIASLEAAEGRDLEVHSFVNQWSELYPDEAVKWYQPVRRILKSLEMVEDIQRVAGPPLSLNPLNPLWLWQWLWQ